MSRARLLLNAPFLFHSVWLWRIVETFSLDARCGTPLPDQASRCVGQLGLLSICMTLPWKTIHHVFCLQTRIDRWCWKVFFSIVVRPVPCIEEGFFGSFYIFLSSVTFIRVVSRIITVTSRYWIGWQVPICLILFDWVGPLLIWCSRWDRDFSCDVHHPQCWWSHPR